VAAIQWQFHQLLRMVPGHGLLVVNGADANLARVIEMGCWTPVERFSGISLSGESGADAGTVADDSSWHIAAAPDADYSCFAIMEGPRRVGEVRWTLPGRHNAENALAAILAARHAGVQVEVAIAALEQFQGVRRRMEIRGVVDGITVYDDFAHHPTAVHTTIDGLRRRIGAARLIAVLEPRSNTMKLGTHRDALAHALVQADRVWMYQGPGVQWDVAGAVAVLGERVSVVHDIDELVAALAGTLVSGDHVLLMSNGGFGGIHTKLLDALARGSPRTAMRAL